MNGWAGRLAFGAMCALLASCGGGHAPGPSGSSGPSIAAPSPSHPPASTCVCPSTQLPGSPVPSGAAIYADILATDDGSWPTGPKSGIDPEFTAGIYQVTISNPGAVFVG